MTRWLSRRWLRASGNRSSPVHGAYLAAPSRARASPRRCASSIAWWPGAERSCLPRPAAPRSRRQHRPRVGDMMVGTTRYGTAHRGFTIAAASLSGGHQRRRQDRDPQRLGRRRPGAEPAFHWQGSLPLLFLVRRLRARRSSAGRRSPFSSAIPQPGRPAPMPWRGSCWRATSTRATSPTARWSPAGNALHTR